MVSYRVYLLDRNSCAREVSSIEADCDAEAVEQAKKMTLPGGKVGLWGEPQPDIVICDVDDHPRPLVAAVVRRSNEI